MANGPLKKRIRKKSSEPIILRKRRFSRLLKRRKKQMLPLPFSEKMANWIAGFLIILTDERRKLKRGNQRALIKICRSHRLSGISDRVSLLWISMEGSP